MNKQISAAVIAAAIVGAPIAAFAQTAYLPSHNGWAGQAQVAAPANVPSVSPFDGPRPSALGNWGCLRQRQGRRHRGQGASFPPRQLLQRHPRVRLARLTHHSNHR
jgi:hypothetical protein